MRIFVLILSILFPLVLFTENVEAKVLPQAKKTSAILRSAGGATIGVSPRLRADRRALIVNFSNLQNAKSVSYFLTYKQVSSSGSKTSVQEEGAGGGLNLTGGQSQSAELLFGTCSKNVCRYHTGIKDAKLEVTYTSKSGKKYLKKFKIKV